MQTASEISADAYLEAAVSRHDDHGESCAAVQRERVTFFLTPGSALR